MTALLVACVVVTATARDEIDLAAELKTPPRRVDASRNIIFDFEWRVPLVRTGALRSVNVSFVKPAILAKHKLVIVGTGEGDVKALNLKDGSVAWVSAHGEPFEGAVSLFESVEGGPSTSMVVLGSRDGTLLALDAPTGRRLWTVDIGGDVRAPIARSGDTLVVQTAQNQVMGLDIASGKSRWTAGRPAPTRLTVAGHARPLVADGAVYAAFSDGYVEAYSLADGGRRWSRPLSLKGGDFMDADADPQLANGRLFVASYSDGVFALDPKDGQTVWSRNAPAVRSLAVFGDRLVAGSGDGFVWSLLQADGAVQFRTKLEAGFATRFTIADGLVVFAGGDSGLVVLDSQSGRPLQAAGYRVRFQGDATWGGPTVAMVSADGHLYLFRYSGPPRA
jgi:outer membrane protein assembly factor BamB